MNFNNLVLEELEKPIIVRDMTMDELIKVGEYLEDNDHQACEYLDFNHGWFVTQENTEQRSLPYRYYCYVIPFIPSILPANDSMGRAYDKVAGRTADFRGFIKKDSKVAKAIKHWEFKKNLSSSTLNTFGDLIDEL
jgi:hypothetical protein